MSFHSETSTVGCKALVQKRNYILFATLTVILELRYPWQSLVSLVMPFTWGKKPLKGRGHYKASKKQKILKHENNLQIK